MTSIGRRGGGRWSGAHGTPLHVRGGLVVAHSVVGSAGSSVRPRRLRAVLVVLGIMLAGALFEPSVGRGGRLRGVLWPMPPPQVGLSKKSFNGLPVDTASLAQDQGLMGAALVAAMLVVVLIAPVFRPSAPGHAVASFLVVYCADASYTEVGLGDASPSLLHLVVAASWLASPSDAQSSAQPALTSLRPLDGWHTPSLHRWMIR